jgi:hypothetical protein
MEPTNHAGLMPTLLRLGCFAWNKPMRQRASPLEGKTTDWRAGCGRTASPVRREGAPKPIDAPYPYHADLIDVVALALGLVNH